MLFHDRKNNRLVIFKEEANREYWDKHWKVDNLIEKVREGKKNNMLRKFTSKFLKRGSRVLEGGCGIGQNVYGLKHWGYKAYGVDFAKETVKKVKSEFPELNLSIQDVRNLGFPSNFFDGYWSLGVIEHFWDGYEEILKEAERVIKPRGYLFLSFPYMSPLRALKAKLGLYRILEEKVGKSNFYQFILDKDRVRKDVEEKRFKFLLEHPFDATKGVKDEILILRPILRRIYNSRRVTAKVIRFLISLIFSRVAGHCILQVFQKESE